MGSINNFEGFDHDRIAAEVISQQMLERHDISIRRAYFTYHDVARLAFASALEGLKVGSDADYYGSYDDLTPEAEAAFDGFLDTSYDEKVERARLRSQLPDRI